MRSRSSLSPGRGPASRSYRSALAPVQIAALLLLLVCLPANSQSNGAPHRSMRIVALGDSLTAGLGLPLNASFPARLEAALKAKGAAVEIANAGVSGDTASAGLARLDWSVPEGTDAALTDIVRRLTGRNIVVLLAGMRAAPNLGLEYGREFEAIFSDLAASNAASSDLVIYPFFLDGVAADASLNQADGIHPTAAGVDEIVARILPAVEELIARARRKHPA